MKGGGEGWGGMKMKRYINEERERTEERERHYEKREREIERVEKCLKSTKFANFS